MKISLSTLNIGDTATLVNFGACTKPYRHQLLSMGLTPGTEFTLLRIAPLGDPIEISVRGSTLCLRLAEASSLVLERD